MSQTSVGFNRSTLVDKTGTFVYLNSSINNLPGPGAYNDQTASIDKIVHEFAKKNEIVARKVEIN